MKFFLTLSMVLTLSSVIVEAQDGVTPAGAISPRPDVIQSPVQLRHHGFPVKDTPFTDPVLMGPVGAPKAETKPLSDRGPSNLAD